MKLNKSIIIFTLSALTIIFIILFAILLNTISKNQHQTRTHIPPGRDLTTEEKGREIKRPNDLRDRDPSIEWKTPFEFHAVYIDEEGKPIPGLTIQVGWNSINGPKKATLKTDSHGRISLKNKKGKILDAIPISNEYSPATNQHIRSFEFFDTLKENYWPPDGSKSAIIVMRKKLNPEPLLVGKFRLDLRKGESHASARFNPYRTSPKEEKDGLIQLTLELPEPPTNRQGYHWSFEMRGHGIEFAPSELYESVKAPEDGYTNIIRYDFDSKSDPWQASTGQKMFYFKTNNNKYGFIRLRADVFSNETGKAIVDFYYNPSGSKVLEQGISIRK